MKRKIRNIGASIVAKAFLLLGFAGKIKRESKKGNFILSIYFHKPSKPLFEFCVKWLKNNNFQFLSQEDILEIYRKERPFPKASVLMTVDDGWQSNLKNIVEVAEKEKVPVTIFITTQAVEDGHFWWPLIISAQKMNLTRYSVEALKKLPNKDRIKEVQRLQKEIQLPREAMTIKQVQEIAQYEYVTLGSHTLTHPILVQCPEEQIYEELKDAKEKIESWIGKEVKCFAYPNGDYGERETKCLEENGYSVAYTTEAAYLTDEKLQHIFELPRFCLYEEISKAEAVCRMLGLWQKFVK